MNRLMLVRFPGYFEKLEQAADFTLDVDGTFGCEEEYSHLSELSAVLNIDHALDGRITIGDLCHVDPVYVNDSADITQVDESDYSKAMRKATKRAAWEREAPRRAEQGLAIKRRERQAWLAEQERADAERRRKEAERIEKETIKTMEEARIRAEKYLKDRAEEPIREAARMAQVMEYRKNNPYWNCQPYSRREGDPAPAVRQNTILEEAMLIMMPKHKPAEYCVQTDGFEWPGR